MDNNDKTITKPKRSNRPMQTARYCPLCENCYQEGLVQSYCNKHKGQIESFGDNTSALKEIKVGLQFTETPSTDGETTRVTPIISFNTMDDLLKVITNQTIMTEITSEPNRKALIKKYHKKKK